MTGMRAALVQMTSSDDPAENLATVLDYLRQASAARADIVMTPEVTNCVATSRARQDAVLSREEDDPLLAAVRSEAARLGLWVMLGSLAIKTGDPDGRFANRCFLIGADGAIVARYDKIHMFDVQVTDTETHRESAGFRPGTRAVVADTPFARLGLTICYDLRFPHLHRALAHAGAQVLTAPAAFTPPTGKAHWEVLLRARAIETGCFVLAPAQTGSHRITEGRPRTTHGHSLAISPWGEVLADAGTAPGLTVLDLDLGDVEIARARIPALTHDRPFDGP
jgi:predicted amidohydrolase